MNTKEREEKILSANLSGRYIPVGECKDEDIIMDELKTSYKQLNAWVTSFQEQFADFRATTETTLKFIQQGVSDIKKEMGNTASKRELNGVVSSLREDVEEAKQCADRAQDAARATEAANRKFIFAFMGSVVGLGGLFIAAMKLIA
jgi:ATP/maltotriose-dependent transcriptional regulator MalT